MLIQTTALCRMAGGRCVIKMAAGVNWRLKAYMILYKYKICGLQPLLPCANMHLPQGWAGMTFEGSGTGTGIENSIPKVWEREGNWKFHSQNSGTGREWKNPFPKFGNGKGMKKGIPEIREREGNEKKLSQNSGTGIRGYYSREWTGTGIERKNYDD